MFSKRTSWRQEANRISELAGTMRRQGRTINDLTVSNPAECGIRYPENEILAAFQSKDILQYHPDPRGRLKARKAVVEYYSTSDTAVDPSNIFLQSSTSEGYGTVFKILCDPGDTVLMPRPSYPLFEFLAGLNDVCLEPYSLRYDGEWHIDFHSLRSAISERTRGIIVVNPNNPTGAFLKQRELDILNSLALERHLALIVDEVFIDYGFAEHKRASTAANTRALTFTLNGISKTLGLPQMKLGWIAVSGPDTAVREAVSRLEMVCDTFLSVNTPVQAALPELFRICKLVREEIRNRTQSNFRYLTKTLCPPLPFSVFSSEGGWYGLIGVPRIKSDEQWCLDLLEKNGVLVYPGYFFDIEEDGALVVSLIVKEEEFHEGVEAIKIV